MAALDMYEFKKHLAELAEKRGRHTELISVYVPPGYEMCKIIGQLSQEQGTASNIKSTSTRKNVTGALEKMIQHLSLFKTVPEKGMAVFTGNVSEKEGKTEWLVQSIIPPLPIAVKMYRCEQKFVLEPLEQMLEHRNVYGLLVMDNGGATIGRLNGKSIEKIREIKSLVFGKFRAGGQSAHRFENVREGLINDLHKEIGKAMQDIFGSQEIRGLIIGGPGPAKESFVEGAFMHNELKNKIIGIKDIGYTDEYGLHELVERSQDLLENEEIAHEKKVLKEFFTHLGKDGPVVYGEKEVREALNAGAVETLILSDSLDKARVEVTCEGCGWKQEATVHFKEFEHRMKNEKCPKCDSPNVSISSRKDLIEELAELAETTKVNVEVVSTETDEGAQLAQLGGIGAVLRFKI